MSRVRLRVALDHFRDPFSPGDEVAGRVEVEVDEDVSCAGLAVRSVWVTGGDANETRGEGPDVVLPGGDWRSGDRHSFPFRAFVREGPPSYHGKNLRVSWGIEAVADLSWAVDPKAWAPIDVEVPPAEGETLVSKDEGAACAVGCALTMAMLVLVAAGAIAFEEEWDVPPFVSWIGGIVCLLVLGFAIPAAITARRLGKVTIEAGPSPCPRGGEMAVRVTLRPRKDTRPSEVKATLTGTEKSVKGSGKSRSVREVAVHVHEVRLDGPSMAQAGTEAVYAGLIPIPEGVPPSFEAGDHGVSWKVKVEVVLPRMMDADWAIEPRVG